MNVVSILKCDIASEYNVEVNENTISFGNIQNLYCLFSSTVSCNYILLTYVCVRFFSDKTMHYVVTICFYLFLKEYVHIISGINHEPLCFVQPHKQTHNRFVLHFRVYTMERRLLLLQLDQCALQWMKSSSVVVVGLSKYVFTSSSSTFSVACKPLLVAHRHVENLSKKNFFAPTYLPIFQQSKNGLKNGKITLFWKKFFFNFFCFWQIQFTCFFYKKKLGGIIYLKFSGILFPI